MSASAVLSELQVARIIAMGLDEQARAAMPQDRKLALAIELDTKTEIDFEGGDAVISPERRDEIVREHSAFAPTFPFSWGSIRFDYSDDEEYGARLIVAIFVDAAIENLDLINAVADELPIALETRIRAIGVKKFNVDIGDGFGSCTCAHLMFVPKPWREGSRPKPLNLDAVAAFLSRFVGEGHLGSAVEEAVEIARDEASAD